MVEAFTRKPRAVTVNDICPLIGPHCERGVQEKAGTKWKNNNK